MLLLILTGVLGYELKTAVGTNVFIMAFTASPAPCPTWPSAACGRSRSPYAAATLLGARVARAVRQAVPTQKRSIASRAWC